jgi:AraC-like DNA-binding protein
MCLSIRPLMLSLVLALWTATAAILLLTGVVMLRDRRQLASGPFGGLLALSVAADCVVAVAGRAGWTWPLEILAMGAPALLWIWAGAVFVDDLRPTWRAALAWSVLPLLGGFEFLAWQPWMAPVHQVLALVFVAAAAWRIAVGLRGDLVERRRQLRPLLAGGAVIYSCASVALSVFSPHRPVASIGRVVEVGLLAALSIGFALLALRAGRPLSSPPVVSAAVPVPAAAAADNVAADEAIADNAADESLLARLRTLMEEDKVYRQEGFGMAALVAALDVPEYRLRRLINQRLGHRNFPSFVNGYRLAEATAALADPAQADVPILTIALDSGFQSIGPFNRAFKAHTGLTPTDFRKQAGRKQAETRKGEPI